MRRRLLDFLPLNRLTGEIACYVIRKLRQSPTVRAGVQQPHARTFVLPPQHDGGIKVVAIYARRLRPRGHRVTLISQPPIVMPLRRRSNRCCWVTLGRRTCARAPTSTTPAEHWMLQSRRAPSDGDVPDAVVIATW